MPAPEVNGLGSRKLKVPIPSGQVDFAAGEALSDPGYRPDSNRDCTRKEMPFPLGRNKEGGTAEVSLRPFRVEGFLIGAE